MKTEYTFKKPIYPDQSNIVEVSSFMVYECPHCKRCYPTEGFAEACCSYVGARLHKTNVKGTSFTAKDAPRFGERVIFKGFYRTYAKGKTDQQNFRFSSYYPLKTNHKMGLFIGVRNINVLKNKEWHPVKERVALIAVDNNLIYYVPFSDISVC